MVEFLSEQWLDALAAACDGGRPGTAAAEAGDGPLTIEPVVHDVPGRGEVRYRVRFDRAGVAVGSAPAGGPAADVRLHTDYATACALARGETNAQAALAGGRLRLAGDVARLAEHAGALAALADLFARVRGVTTYEHAAGASGRPPGDRP